MTRRRKEIISGEVAEIEVAGRIVLVDACEVTRLSDYRLWFARKETTACVQATHRSTNRTTALARLIVRPADGFVVDHVSGNPLDNRRANLRATSYRRNSQNRAKRRDVTSQFKGVSLNAGRWLACIYDNYRRFDLGRFASEIEAAEAYDCAARERFGQYAALNFPKAGEQSAHRPRTISYHGAPNSAGGQHDHA